MWRTTKPAKAKFTQNLRRVLVVEDNPDQWVFIQLAFQKTTPAVEPILAPTVQQATLFLDECERGGGDFPCLILLDLYTPWRDDSLALLEAIRRKPAPLGQTPVVMLTASDDQEDIAAAFATGINSYIIKPARFSAWLDCIRELHTEWLRGR